MKQLHAFQQQPGVRDTCTCGHLLSDPVHGEFWTPTSDNINALPLPIRRYIHDLSTDADPSGTIREAICQRENALALTRRVEELEAEIAALKAEIEKRDKERQS
jgi:uncharacterized small protein (DUF1192 family)